MGKNLINLRPRKFDNSFLHQKQNLMPRKIRQLQSLRLVPVGMFEQLKTILKNMKKSDE
jgi:hypothetical protein